MASVTALGLQTASTDTTAAVTVASVTGGDAETVIVVKDSGNNHLTGSPALWMGSPITFPRTGLSAARHYAHTVSATPGDGDAYGTGVNLFTRQAGLPTTMRVLGVGDSITVGGSPRVTEIARDTLAAWLLIGDADKGEAVVGAVGYTSEQVADLADEVVTVANGGSNGPNTTGALGGNADLIVIRLGKNDSSSTPAETAASVQVVIDAVRSGCAHDPWILILPVTGYGGTGADGPMADDRQYQCYDEFALLEDLPDRVAVAPRLSWWFYVWNPNNLSDGVHPPQEDRATLAEEIVWGFALKFLSGVAG